MLSRAFLRGSGPLCILGEGEAGQVTFMPYSAPNVSIQVQYG